MGLLNFIGELVITRVDTATPDDTILVVKKNGSKSWEAINGDVDGNDYEYAGQTASGFHAISEKENTVTKKGLLEGILSLL